MGRRKAFEASLLLGLYLAGVLNWVVLFGTAADPLRGPSFTHEDWPKEYRYYSLLQQAVREARLPYYISRPIHTRRFLALPEVSWSPQVLLLRFLEVGPFVLANTLLLYTAGFIGLLLLRHRFRLSLAPFALMFLLFNLNGHVVAHLAVGHSMWVAHFLLTFVVLAVLDLVTGRGGGVSELGLALVLFLMLLQGGFHHFTWCVFFLGLLALFERARAGAILRTLLWTAALSACRLLPAYFLVRRVDQGFLSGFPSLAVFGEGLVCLRGALTSPLGGRFGELRWWEYDSYVGLAGLLWLGFFGIWGAVRRDRDAQAPPVRALAAPLAVMTLFSFGDLFAPWNALPVPLLSAERVSTRFFALPLVFLVVFAAVAMQRWIEVRPSLTRRVASLAMVLLVAASLGAHTRLWRLESLEWTLVPRPGNLEIAIAPLPDAPGPRERAYVIAVRASALVSLGALCLLSTRWARLRRAGLR